MNKDGKSLMFGPAMPLNPKRMIVEGKPKTTTKTDMGAMTDLVKVLKDVNVSPEKIDQNKHGGTGTATGKHINLGEDNPCVELG